MEFENCLWRELEQKETPKQIHLKKEFEVPSLPIPSLEQTLFRYLVGIRALTTDEEFKRAAEEASDFAKKEGPLLHASLLKRKEEKGKTTSWLREWWDSLVYLQARHNITIMDSYFFNYGLGVPKIASSSSSFSSSVSSEIMKSGYSKMILRAAATILASFDFKRLLDFGELKQEGSPKRPQSMDMFGKLFNTCRIPQPKEDRIFTYHGAPHASNHIFVTFGDSFYFLDVTSKIDDASGDYSVISFEEIAQQLYSIVKDGEKRKEEFPAAALSCQIRETWSVDRDSLISASSRNALILRGIESAAFGVCLDPSSPETLDEMDECLWHNHGHGRFFDKAVQFIIFANGRAGLHGEHSGMDGTVVGFMSDYVTFLLENQFSGLKIPIKKGKGTNLWQPIHFDLTPHLKERVTKALEDLEAEIQLIDHKALFFTEFGGKAIKKLKCSPDAFMQLAIQYAFYRILYRLPSHYESASTRRFFHGRTETIRVSSIENLRFVSSAAKDPSNLVSPINKKLLRDALNSHVYIAQNGANAQGVDRHLLGLRLIQKEKDPNSEFHALFTDPTFSRCCTWEMSTSQLGGKNFQAGYGAVVDHGLGVSYSYADNHLQYKISSRQMAPVSPKVFANSLAQSLRDLYAILTAPDAKL
mmetsp:Transcript_9287/g.12518  ORF Transcript_9287/g.12518 Transcript_9287/m.12518 type:complete len:643 (-) Transcript_9287:27-1955(-)|eukprot:CAMPEP_0201493056 /NCGR_PEP_ID=MMETSP0151_2-20130828/35930_1 /ASSEMBLY_ACC=CAM_ASM_000257 /TAXON_ID=200890 /ORGANISM="Paramoeba atlantica, Strain 621/1 / CCAP 1560/9" /LENGTH=642 /DNA_ID=CAMNT_0047880193 /DNA_START=46 /DNA_END=1974 /DNA_ORIENTATION=+